MQHQKKWNGSKRQSEALLLKHLLWLSLHIPLGFPLGLGLQEGQKAVAEQSWAKDASYGNNPSWEPSHESPAPGTAD